MKASKLALGTVQFGLDYGINNQRGKIPQSEVFDVLSLAWGAGIDTLDTSAGYGDSEQVIGAYVKGHDENFNVVSKFSMKDAQYVHQVLTQSLMQTGFNFFYGYLFHCFEDFKKNPQTWDELKSLQDAGKIRKIGFSLYLEEELEYVLEEKLKIDLVQVPYSVFDRRFEKYFRSLHEAGVEIHTRSSFLQGLVFKKPEELDQYFEKIKSKIGQLHQLAKINNVTVAELCLQFVLSMPFIDKVLVGVDNLSHLQEMLAIREASPLGTAVMEQLMGLEEVDQKIILPFNWKIT